MSITHCAYMLERYVAIDCIQYTLLNGDSGITRDLVTMATQSITTGGCDMDDDGDGSQGTAEHNFVPQPSTSPEPVSNLPCNQKQIKSRPYTSKEVLPQKVQSYVERAQFQSYINTRHINNTFLPVTITFLYACVKNLRVKSISMVNTFSTA